MDFAAELDRWGEAGRTAEFWWRDDDAETAAPALARLLDIRRAAAAPLAIAVVPAHADDGLETALADDGVDVLQHGFAHVNHAAEGAQKCELGDTRALAEICGELANGRDRLSALFGPRALPVLAPPWNRISARVVGELAALGYRGLSMFKARPAAEAAPGLIGVNTHVDIIDWRGDRGFRGEDAALSAALDHLAARRSGRADAAEPTGLLTHHLVHDAACDAFVEKFADAVNGHPAARWASARELFGIAR